MIRLAPQPAPLLLALALVTGTPLAQAQGPAWDSPAAVSIRIAAQPLGLALGDWALQTRIQLIVNPQLVAGRTAPAVSGQLTPRQALDRLLQGTGLVARAEGAAVVVQAAARDAGGTLAPTVVTARAERETAAGPVPGYVARRGTTGTKTDTPLIENPQSISVISAEEIGDRKAETLDETLRYTAGVTPNQKPWAADLYSLLRGFELGSSGVFLDGLLNPNVSYMATIDPYGLERLEVLRGPASVLYGQMAPGGMVNAVSKRPTREAIREVGLEYGTYDRRQFKADFGGPLDGEAGAWSYRLTLLARRSETRLDHDQDDRTFVAPSLSWQPDAATRLTLLALYQKDVQKYAWPNQLRNPGPRGQPDPAVSIGGVDNRWTRTNTMVGYELEHRFDDRWSLRQNLRYSDLDRAGTDVLSGALNPDGRSVARVFSPRGNAWKGLLLDTRVQAQFATGALSHTALAGVDYAKSRLTWRRPYANTAMPAFDLFAPSYAAVAATPSANPYDDQLPLKQAGLYLQDQAKWESWVLTTGVRHDRVDQARTRTFWNTGATSVSYDQSFSATTGRVGLVRLFDSGWAPYVSYATSFAPETGTSVTGEALKPSRGRQLEAGVRYQPAGESVSYTAALFDLTRENVTTAAPGNPNAFVQTGEIVARGLELEARTQLARNFSVIAQYTYLDTEVTRSNNGDQGLPQKGAPRHSASAWAKYSFPAGSSANAYAALGVRHLGKARSAQDWGNANIGSPALTVVDAALGLEQGPWRFSVNVNNLFDKQKLIDCDAALCYRSAERTVNLSALYRF